jgi:hypothetical protein
MEPIVYFDGIFFLELKFLFLFCVLLWLALLTNVFCMMKSHKIYLSHKYVNISCFFGGEYLHFLI